MVFSIGRCVAYSYYYSSVLHRIFVVIGNRPRFHSRRSLIKTWFTDNDTYIIVCKGYPKKDTTGISRIETAKEAALINAQFIAKNTFNDSVDVIKNGIIEKYDIQNEYVVIYYKVKYKGLKRKIKSK